MTLSMKLWMKNFKVGLSLDIPTTVGSKSTKTARGTCFPAPVSLKKVLKESSPPPMVLSLGIWPSGWIPCSKQYNSQQALPICTPACPTWTEIHSRCEETKKESHKKHQNLSLTYRSLNEIARSDNGLFLYKRLLTQPRNKWWRKLNESLRLKKK